jgi:hypothetical protein
MHQFFNINVFTSIHCKGDLLKHHLVDKLTLASAYFAVPLLSQLLKLLII